MLFNNRGGHNSQYSGSNNGASMSDYDAQMPISGISGASSASSNSSQKSLAHKMFNSRIATLLDKFFKNRSNLFIFWSVIFSLLLGIFIGSSLFGITTIANTGKVDVDFATRMKAIDKSLHEKLQDATLGNAQVNVPLALDEYLGMFNESMYEEDWINNNAFYPESRKIPRVARIKDAWVFYRGCVGMSRPYIFTKLQEQIDAEEKTKLFSTKFWKLSRPNKPDFTELIKRFSPKLLSSLQVSIATTTADQHDHVFSLASSASLSLEKALGALSKSQEQVEATFIPFAHLPGFKKEFSFQRPTLALPDAGNVFLTMGKGNSEVIPIHQLPFEVITCQITGTTDYYLYNPLQYRFLYTTLVQDSVIPKNVQRKYLPLDTNNLLVSPINAFSYNNDEEKEQVDGMYPLFKQTLKHKVTLGAGECLFIPSFWFTTSKTLNNQANIRLSYIYDTHSRQFDAFWRLFRKTVPQQDTIPSIV